MGGTAKPDSTMALVTLQYFQDRGYLSGASLVGLQPARGEALVLLCLMQPEQGAVVRLEGKGSKSGEGREQG